MPDADVPIAVQDVLAREDVIPGDEIANQIGRHGLAAANLRQQGEHAERQEFATVHRHNSSGFINVPSGARSMSITATIASRLRGP